MNIWSRRAVISQTYKGMQTFLESPQLDEKNMSINRLTNRPCFPSIFDVSTMLKLCCCFFRDLLRAPVTDSFEISAHQHHQIRLKDQHSRRVAALRSSWWRARAGAGSPSYTWSLMEKG